LVWSKNFWPPELGPHPDIGEDARGWLFHGMAALEQHFYPWGPWQDAGGLGSTHRHRRNNISTDAVGADNY
jgi:hypothetical protein